MKKCNLCQNVIKGASNVIFDPIKINKKCPYCGALLFLVVHKINQKVECNFCKKESNLEIEFDLVGKPDCNYCKYKDGNMTGCEFGYNRETCTHFYSGN